MCIIYVIWCNISNIAITQSMPVALCHTHTPGINIFTQCTPSIVVCISWCNCISCVCVYINMQIK